MSAFPVIIRELRAQARWPFNRWLRIIGACVAVAALAITMRRQDSIEADFLGAQLFGNLNFIVFTAIWIVGPLLTADCVSREKREGTFGLLFLTSLSPLGIVVGKSVTHCLRAITLLLAVTPALVIPFVIGGVTWQDAVVALLVSFSSIVLALTAGLVGSIFFKNWANALGCGLVVSSIFCSIYAVSFSFQYNASVSLARGTGPSFGASIPFPSLSRLGSEWLTFFKQPVRSFKEFADDCTRTAEKMHRLTATPTYSAFGPMGAFVGTAAGTAITPSAVYDQLLPRSVGLFVGSLWAAFLVLLIASASIRRNWKDQPPSALGLKVREKIFSPSLLQQRFRSSMSRLLDRNPVGWLHNWSVWARLMKWGWFFLTLAAVLPIVVEHSSGTAGSSLFSGPEWLATALVLGIAVAAANSFKREKECGAFELLLVAPLGEREIIGGRVWGIWQQFMPSFGLLFAVWVYLAYLISIQFGGDMGIDLLTSLLFEWTWIALCFLTLPVIGLCFSMWVRSPVMASLFTICGGIMAPVIIPVFVDGIFGPMLRFNESVIRALSDESIEALILVVGTMLMAATQLGLAYLCFRMLLYNLRQRRFVTVTVIR